jgi:hypothetical protein
MAKYCCTFEIMFSRKGQLSTHFRRCPIAFLCPLRMFSAKKWSDLTKRFSTLTRIHFYYPFLVDTVLIRDFAITSLLSFIISNDIDRVSNFSTRLILILGILDYFK